MQAAEEADARGRARRDALLSGIQALRRPETQAALAAGDKAAFEAAIRAQKEKRKGAASEVRTTLPPPLCHPALRTTNEHKLRQ